MTDLIKIERVDRGKVRLVTLMEWTVYLALMNNDCELCRFAIVKYCSSGLVGVYVRELKVFVQFSTSRIVWMCN